MKTKVDLSIPEFGFVLVTRAALAAGLGLLATGRAGRRHGTTRAIRSRGF